MSVKPISVPTKFLARSISSSATSFKVNNIKGWGKNSLGAFIDLVPSDFGTQAWCVFRNDTGTVIEIMEFDPATIASDSITIIDRGLPFDGTATAVTNYKFAWPAGTTIEFGTDNPLLLNALAGGGTAALALKANLASPTFTGTVVLPSTTSIGTVSATEISYLDGVTSAIQTQLNLKAPLASPTFTGTVTAATSVFSSNDSTNTVTITNTGGGGGTLGALVVTGGSYVNNDGVRFIANFKDSNGSSVMMVQNGGRTGFGTTTPSYRVHSKNADGSLMNYWAENSSTGDAAIGFEITGITGWGIGIDNSDSDKFKISGSSSDLGVNTRLTIDASGVATLAVAGTLAGSIATIDGTQTLTAKRITKRVVAVTQSATPVINTDNTDVAYITGLAQAITSMTSSLSGTPVNGDTLIVDVTDNGTARAITWGASFEASTVPLPTTTVISTKLTVGFRWNVATSKWTCVSVA